MMDVPLTLEGDWITVDTPEDVSVKEWVKIQLQANLDRQIELQEPLEIHNMITGVYWGPPRPTEALGILRDFTYQGTVLRIEQFPILKKQFSGFTEHCMSPEAVKQELQ